MEKLGKLKEVEERTCTSPAVKVEGRSECVSSLPAGDEGQGHRAVRKGRTRLKAEIPGLGCGLCHVALLPSPGVIIHTEVTALPSQGGPQVYAASAVKGLLACRSPIGPGGWVLRPSVIFVIAQTSSQWPRVSNRAESLRQAEWDSCRSLEPCVLRQPKAWESRGLVFSA